LNGGARHRRAASIALAVALGGLASSASAAVPPPSSPPAAASTAPTVVYGGDESFPPYEYLDADGEPRGFNVALVRALAAQAGVRVEVRLEEWWTLLRDFDAGKVDLVSLPLTEERSRRYDLVAQTWTFQQEVLFADRAQAARGPDDLGGRRVAVVPGTLTDTLLEELEPSRRPQLVPVDGLVDALRAVAEGRAAGVAGNGLALRAAARDAGLRDLVEVPLRSVPYALAAARGRGRSFSWVGEALNRLHETGQFNHLVEDHLIIRPGPATWRDFALPLGLGLAGTLSVGGLVLGWNRALRQKVRARTRELAESLAEKEALAGSLHEREQQLEEAQEIAHVGSWEWAVGTERVSCSQELFRILGVNPTTFPARQSAFLELVHPEDRPVARDGVRQAVAEGRALDLALRIVRGEGTVRHLHVRAQAVRDGSGAVARLVGTAQDVTWRRLGELAAEREREQLRSIVNHAPVAMAILDRDLRYVAHSERWLKYWRLRGRELLGVRHEDVFPALPEAYRDALRQALEGKVVTRREDPFPAGDGFPVYIRWTMHPWRSVGRTVDGVVVVAQNIDVLVRAREAARESSRHKSEFLANMSHEIRTPLNGVMGMTRLLIDTRLDRQQREYAEMIRESGRTLLDLINDILDFSKIEAGRLDLEAIDFDPALTLEEAVTGFAERAASKRLELAMTVDPEVPRLLRGDPGRLTQVLNNLLGNAVKFTDRGEVVARVALAEEWEEEAVVQFSVADTGVGIPEEAVPRLFQPFSQADHSTTRRFGGTGLGLAISKRLVDLMSGGIGVSSIPGQGSTFWFTARLKRPESPRAAGPPPLAGRLALLAAPSATLAAAVAQPLQALGMFVRTATDLVGMRGTLEDESSDDIDLVVVDAGLPGLDLPALAAEVRARSRVARVVLLAPFGRRPGEGDGGADAVVSKPVRPSVFGPRMVAVVTGDTPVTVPEPAGSAAATVDPHAPLVLVVEDNEINRAVALRTLERLGYRAAGARNGQEAVERFTPETYAAVLMDCQMPVMDGYQATARLRALEAGRRPTPVLAMTAGALTGDRERCLAAGMDDYIAKPVVFEALAALLERWAPRGGLAVAPGGTAPASPLDGRVVDQLRALDRPGSGFFEGIVGLFLETTPERLDALEAAVSHADVPSARALAHALRSTCGNVGARRMSDLCAEIEERAAAGDGGLGARVRALADEFRQVRQALEAEQRPARPPAPRSGS
jgi:PAS domain S-box-containing protein